MEIAAHIDALRAEGERMVVAVADADPDGGVPSCPEWTVRELVRHLGGIHRWATGFVATGRTEPSHADLGEVVGSWPADDDLARWLGQGCADLVAALEAAPDDLQCWTFLAAPSPRAMWARRQAHETAMHRVDMQQAVGAAVAPLEAAFAADGVDELLQLFVPRRSTKLRADPPTTLAVGCTDVDASWLLRLDTDGVQTTPAPRGDEGADCTVRGTSCALSLALWNRSGAEHLTVEGDHAVLDQFSEGVRIRWS
ncbi:MAG TPA: maleylpyruvate isomerase family mycothiol-dependent enzyme [Acidimicrobiales bacterium]|jgi:uncharacterized protein (TIGR03083 family)|nr:maleylpyruvate isomerase family mycothiol-dependent enzyme [Acidimicrobiales bacterium]